jgi:outer membrane protein assembly factor BamB
LTCRHRPEYSPPTQQRRASLRVFATLFTALFAGPRVAPARTTYPTDTPVQSTSPWPEMRHDRRNTGRSPIVARYHGDRPWAFRTAKGIFSTPILAGDGTIYVGSADTHFYAIAPSGQLRWRFRTGNIIDSAAVIGRYDPHLKTSPITFGSGDEFLYHLRTDRRRLSRNRRIIWKYKATERCTEGQLVNWWEGNVEIGLDGTLYAGNTGGCAYAIAPDGTPRWTYATGNSVWTDAARGDDGTTYWGSLDLAIHAVDANGQLVWRTPTLGFVVSSPALGRDGTLYVGSFDGRFRALDARTGQGKWSVRTGDHVYSSPALAEDAAGNTTGIYFASADGSIYALAPDGTIRWRYDTGDTVRSSPALGPSRKGDVVYVGSANGKLYAIGADDGRRRWSFDTTAGEPVLRDRNDLNASPALGRTGVYIGSESGFLWYVPYDYCLHRRDPRCDRDPGQAFAADVNRVFLVTAGGSTEVRLRTPLSPSAVLPVRLVVRQHDQSIDASMQPDLVATGPHSDVTAALSGDGHYVFVVPDGFLEPGRNYHVWVAGSYTTTGLPASRIPPGTPPAGMFADGAAFRTARTRGPLPLHVADEEVSALSLRRLASPLPPFVPSLNQIGFDSYDWIVGTLDVSPPRFHEGTLLLWVIGARRGAGGVPVADPGSAFAFPLAGRYRDDAVILSDRGLTLTFSFGAVPFQRIDFRGQLSSRLRMRPGANLYAEVVCADVPFYGPFLVPLTRLCNAEGKLIASGTFITRAYPRRGPANKRPTGLRASDVALQHPSAIADGAVTATLTRSGGRPYLAREHVTSILLVDAASGAPLVLDYAKTTAVTADANGEASHIALAIPAGTALPESVTAYVIADVFPLHREPFPAQ